MAEINIIGDFSFNPAIQIADEVKMLQQNSWAPTSVDFRGVVTKSGGRSVIIASDFGSFLNAIVNSPARSIQTINVFTHADTGYIAFSGEVDSTAKLAASVQLNTNAAQQVLIALDASSLSFLRNGGKVWPKQ
ncbi:MAG: hypothetical protein ABR881_17810 [Candidatus Sulfotelmatobacter sp.]|jgi:hypothetical protein